MASGTISRKKDVKAKGTIQLNIDTRWNVMKQKSSIKKIGSLPWELITIVENSHQTNFVDYLLIQVECNGGSSSPLWSCEAFVALRVLNDPIPFQFTHTFYHKCNSRKCDLGKLKEICLLKNGFKNENHNITVEAHISVLKVTGVRLTPGFDFMTPHPRSDGILLIENVRLHINKSYLALYSPVLSAMFYGDFKEGILDEIPLEDNILEEFVELLHVIYPNHKPVSAENVEYLLKLGDQCDVHYVMEACEKFLVGTSCEIPIIKKLLWAEQYKLVKLQDHCIKGVKNLEDVTKLKGTPGYEDLSYSLKAAILDNIVG